MLDMFTGRLATPSGVLKALILGDDTAKFQIAPSF